MCQTYIKSTTVLSDIYIALFYNCNCVWLHTSHKKTKCFFCCKLLCLLFATTLATNEVQIVDKNKNVHLQLAS